MEYVFSKLGNGKLLVPQGPNPFTQSEETLLDTTSTPTVTTIDLPQIVQPSLTRMKDRDDLRVILEECLEYETPITRIPHEGESHVFFHRAELISSGLIELYARRIADRLSHPWTSRDPVDV